MKLPSWRVAVLGASLLIGARSVSAAETVTLVETVEQQVSAARFKELENLASRTDDEVLELALGYDEREDVAKARVLYAEAAARGVAVADLRLGWLYESGMGGEQSYTTARTHYEKALAAGVQEANLRLGLLYLEGWGVKRNISKTLEYMQRAAEAGYQPAQEILSLMYFAGVGVKADLKEATRWAELAARPDNVEAQVIAGNIRSKAARLPSDLQAARDWYQLSAEAEYTKGMRLMAATFLRPHANPEEEEAGLRWLALAVENGDGMAGFYLAGVYLSHPRYRGTDRGIQTARRLLETAAAHGELASREVLELEKEGRELPEAFRYVVSEPVENRYIKRLADRAADAEANPQGDVQPRPLKVVQPVYPAALKLANVTGKVRIEFIVDHTGRVTSPRVVSSTHPGFSENAIAAITAWRFRPGYKAGRPVNVRVQLPIEFELEGIPALKVDAFKKAAQDNADVMNGPPSPP